jgi:hypothetical protein
MIIFPIDFMLEELVNDKRADAFYINEIHLESGHKNWSNSNKGPVKFYLKKGAWSITPVINSMSLPLHNMTFYNEPFNITRHFLISNDLTSEN